MKNINYRKIICELPLLIIFFTFHLLPFTSHAQKEGCRIVRDDWQQLQIEFTVGNPEVSTTMISGEFFNTLNLVGYQQSLADHGAPSLPLFSRLIEVPMEATFDVKVTDALYDTLPALKHRIVPVQLPRSKSDTTARKLYINNSLYSSDVFFGEQEAIVEAVGVARDRRLARLQFSPVRYNPVSGQVVVCRHATVTVTYRGGDREASLKMFERYYSPAFNSGANTLNGLYPKAVRTTAPVRYVIVANSMFRGHLDSFVQWKRRKGFLTDIVYTDNTSVGTTTTSIAAYLQSLYDNATQANPAPTYVLLVGDVAQLPTFNAQVTSPDNDHVTDLYYSTWTSGDHLPDCHYGRFSAQTIAQLTPQVLKTLMYEQYTFADPSFLDRAVMVAGVDGGNAGDHGYTHADPTMDYAVTNYVNGTHGWSQVMYFKNDVSIIPSCTTNVTIGSSASSNSATVRSYYNQGAGFINYSAHGGSTGWGTPSFNNTQVSQMTNNQKFGLMIGNCCLTNKFEESTCFGEALLRKNEYAGAVGYIGGSNSTYWGQDFYWAVGVRSSIGPTMSMVYDAAHLGVYDRIFHTHGENYSIWCTTQGSIVMQGNMAVENSSTSSDMKHYYWEIYHLMGDPSVMPYMTQASPMTIAGGTIVNYGATSLSLSAAPYAYIALVDTVNDVLIAATYADNNGDATLTLPADCPVGTYLLAASAQQYVTTFQTLTVIQPTGPFPMVTNITSAPFNAGDTVALTLHIENPGTMTARNISIQLTSSSPLLTLSSPTLLLDSLEAGASVDLTAAVSAYVSENASDNTSVDLNTSTTWTGYTQPATSSLRRWIYAPVLSVSFSPANPSLMPGSSTTVTATLHNNGHASTKPASLTATSPTILLSILGSSTSGAIAPDSELAVAFTLQAAAQLPQNIYLPVTCSFGSFSAELPVFSGQSFLETFEGGHTNVAGWSAPATRPWTISSEQPYQGAYCLRSAQTIDHNQQSDMNLNITVTAPDSISFYYRVSSERDYDKFFFLIDGVEQYDDSGDEDWMHVAFPLSVGSHTLTFRYKKDYSVTNNNDCAWIDNITLPHQAHGVSFIHHDTCASNPAASYSVVLTEGDAVTIVDHVAHPSYNLSEEVVACDSLLWQGTLYTATTLVGESLQTVYGCDSIVGLTITVNHSSVGDTAHVNTQANNYEWNGIMYETSGTYQQHFTNSVGCDSVATLVLTFGTQGIDHPSLTSFTVHPNPTTGGLHFSRQVDRVTVYDLTGRVVEECRQVEGLDLGALAPGIYTLRLTCAGSTMIQRVVKQ